MKIKISEGVKKDLTADEYKYLLLLEFNKDFDGRVREIRQNLQIPLKKDNASIESFKKVPNLKALHQKTLQLIINLKIPIVLLPSIESLVQWGQILLAPSKMQVLSAQNLPNRQLLSKTILGKAYPIIQINKRLGKDDFMESVKQMWGEISRAMDEFDEVVDFPTELKHIPIRDLETSVQIYRYRQNGLKHREIYDLLEEKHKKSFAEVEGEVRRKYSQINKLLIDIGFKK